MKSARARFLDTREKLQIFLQLRFPLLYGALRKFRGDHFQLVSFEYPVSNRTPRYGYGKPPHPHLLNMLEEKREAYRATIADIVAACRPLRNVPEHIPRLRHEPYWRNAWFSGADALVLYAFMVRHRPGSLVEIGSGNSTKFARRAIDDNSLQTNIVSIDPHPRAEIDGLCDRVIRSGLEAVNLDIFSSLRSGDFVSFDGSHRSFMNTDVTAFFLDVLPIVPTGVFIQIHDIFLPNDYPPGTPYLNEQYLLATYLLAHPNADLVMPTAYVVADPDLSRPMRDFWRQCGLNDSLFSGSSFWFRKT